MDKRHIRAGKFSGAVVRGILANEFFIPRQFYVQEVNELLKFISVPSWTDLMSFPSLLHSKALFLCLFISFKMHWRCILLLIIWNIRAFVPQWPLSIHVVRQTDRQTNYVQYFSLVVFHKSLISTCVWLTFYKSSVNTVI